MREIDFAIPEGLDGIELRNLLITFQRAHSNINKVRDEAQLDKELIEVAIKYTEASALLYVEGLPSSERPSNADGRKAKAYTTLVAQGEWSVTNDDKTVLDLQRDLVVATYKVRRAASRLAELEKVIDVIRSALAWDRNEVDRIGG